MDLTLRAKYFQPIVKINSVDSEITLEDIDVRSLDEQSEKILSHISSKDLIKEIKYRGAFINELPDNEEIEELRKEIDGLKDRIEKIKDIAEDLL